MFCGLCYKPMTSVNHDSRVVNKLETSLTVDARVVIYDRQMFIIQATEKPKHYKFAKNVTTTEKINPYHEYLEFYNFLVYF